jgi:hypothetical protein
MNKYDIIIGIDPDVNKSGVAELMSKFKMLDLSNLTFSLLLDYLRFMKTSTERHHKSLVVVVEAGWKNSISNYHSAPSRAGQRIAKNVGANHEVGRKVVEMCQHYGIEVVEQIPLKKCWRGKDGKITHEELAAFTGIMGKTNQESRDAALLAWVFAGLPIKIK